MIQRPETTPFRYEITCPHCWKVFPTENILWVAESPELIGDTRLGQLEKTRFLPNGFTTEGYALDLKGFECRKLACPHCHLIIPRCFLEMPPFFVSIVGAPSSGKSYFLSSMTWNLRKNAPKYFSMSFSDADAELNTRLLEYEDKLFTNNSGKLVQLNKTELQGDLYNEITLDGQNITYPKPFIFSFCPTPSHQNITRKTKISLAISLYDNAGESYLPSDGDNASLPVTRHLGMSNCIFFLFDPIQDSRFRELCSSQGSDPQWKSDYSQDFRWTPLRQETVLSEMINRTRAYRHLGSTDQYKNPLFVIITKFDAWKQFLPDSPDRNLWARTEKYGNVLLKDQIEALSQRIRKLFVKMIPQFVGTLEQFASDITFIPVSATGGPPIQDPLTRNWGFDVKKIKSQWTDLPLLYAIAKVNRGMIPMIEGKKTDPC